MGCYRRGKVRGRILEAFKFCRKSRQPAVAVSRCLCHLRESPSSFRAGNTLDTACACVKKRVSPLRPPPLRILRPFPSKTCRPNLRQRFGTEGELQLASTQLTVEVKPGWKKGTKITFSGEGDEGPGIVPADVVLVVTERYRTHGDEG